MEKKPTAQEYDEKHLVNMLKYQRAVKAILDKMCDEAAALGISTGFENGTGETFSFDKFPKARKKFTDLMWRVRQELQATVEGGIDTEWELSTAKCDALLENLIGKMGLTLDQLNKLEPRRLESVHAFQARKQAGLGLSDRVWNITNHAEAQIAEAIEQNLSKGLPAYKLSQAVRKNLQDPNMMYRRYRHKVKMKNGGEKFVRVWHKRVVDADGKVHFVEAPLEAVGTGVYRSAYKNAMRLARTETNMAYHKADSNYFSQSKIILGIEIKLSNNHTTTFGEGKETKELNDICDELQGKYPRWFDFTGWHPNCRCLAMPITPDRKEMREYLKKIANGEDVSGFKFTGMIDKLPDNFRNWIMDNEPRLVRMQARGKLPYFIRENISKNFRFGYGIDPDDAMKWSPFEFEYNEDYDMLMTSEIEQTRPTVEPVQPEQVMEDTEAMIRSLLEKDLAQYADYIQANIAELEKAIGQNRGLSMSYEEANTGKENPNYHLSESKFIPDPKGNYYDKKTKERFRLNPDWKDKYEGWGINCQTCTLVHEMRRRGFNIEAIDNYRRKVWKVYEKNGVGSKLEAYRIGKWLDADGKPVKPYYASEWARKKGVYMTYDHIDDYMKEMLRNDGRYEIYVDWKKGHAHVFCAEVKDGKVTYFDPQSGKTDVWFGDYKENCKPEWIGVIRTDNKQINPKLAKTFIPIGELPIELPNKPNRHEAIMAIAEARHASRTQEHIDELRAYYRHWRGEGYKRRAVARHEARTDEREQEIRDFWNKKKEEGEIRRRKERWDAATKVRHATRDAEDIRRRATERQDKIRVSQIKIQLAQNEWNDVKDWLPNNPLDIKNPENHLYDLAKTADKLFSQARLIKTLRPDYETAAAHKSVWNKYKSMLGVAKDNIINGDGSDAKAIFYQLEIARGMEALYTDMLAYAKAHPSKSKSGKPTKIEVLMEEADDFISNGDFYNAKTKVEEAKKVRDINEASNAAKARKKAEEEARKKAEEEEARKKAERGERKAFDKVNSADELFDVLGNECPVLLRGSDEYEKSISRAQYTDSVYSANHDQIEKKLKAFFENIDFAHCVSSDLLDIKANYNNDSHNGYGAIYGSKKRQGEGIYIKEGIPTNLVVNEYGSGVWKDSKWSLKGEDYDDGRRTWGHWAYGLQDKKNASVKVKDRLEDRDYYVCGTPVPKNDPQAAYDANRASGYGDCQIILRKERVVATWTFGNSLSQYTIPSLVNDPKVCSIDAKRFANWKDHEYKDPSRMVDGSNVSYIELQYLPLKGKTISPKDFRSITFTKGNPEGIISKEAINLWYENGVDLYYVDKGKVKLYRKGKPQITHEEARANLEKMKSIVNVFSDDVYEFGKDLNAAKLQKLVKSGNYIEVYNEVMKLKERRDRVRDLIPEVDRWNKDFTMDEIERAKNYILTKFAKFDPITDVEKRISKYSFDVIHQEFPELHIPGAKRDKTWEMVRDALRVKRDELVKVHHGAKITADKKVLSAYKTDNAEYNAKLQVIDELLAMDRWGDAEMLIKEAQEQMNMLINGGLPLGASSKLKFGNDEFTQKKRDAAVWFKDNDNYEKAYKAADDYMWKNCKELWSKLTDEERHILWLYTDGSTYINHELIGKYNQYLQSPVDGTLRNGIADANVLTTILEKAPALKEAMWMQSGKSKEAFKAMFGIDINSVRDLDSLVGKEGSNDLFMSCHASAHGYFVKGGSTMAENDIIFSIYMPKGTKGAYMEPIASYGDDLRWMDGVMDENKKTGKRAPSYDGKKRKCAPSDQVEFLINRGAKMRITKAYRKNGKWYIDVDLIEQSAVSPLDESVFKLRDRFGIRAIRSPRQRLGLA